MPTICPKDFRSCPDDVCRGSGICGRTGRELLDRCDRCGQVYDDYVGCGCDDEEDDVFPDDEVD